MFAKTSKNVRNFLIFSTLKEFLNNPKSMIHSRKNTAVKWLSALNINDSKYCEIELRQILPAKFSEYK